MCGFSHEDLIGALVVQSPAEFERWLETQRAMSAGLALPDSPELISMLRRTAAAGDLDDED